MKILRLTFPVTKHRVNLAVKERIDPSTVHAAPVNGYSRTCKLLDGGRSLTAKSRSFTAGVYGTTGRAP